MILGNVQNISLHGGFIQERFNHLVKNCQMFSSKAWTAIGGLRHQSKGKEKAYWERIDRINEDLRLIKSGDEFWKKPVNTWTQNQEERQDRLAEHLGQQTSKI
jgi:hypothetical protein